MGFGGEARGQVVVLVAAAARQVEDPVAGDAGEVVVMPLAGDLVARPLPGKVDAGQPALIDQRLDGAVDRGLADPCHAVAGAREDLLRRQRSALVLEDGADRVALRGLSLHRHGKSLPGPGTAQPLTGKSS